MANWLGLSYLQNADIDDRRSLQQLRVSRQQIRLVLPSGVGSPMLAPSFALAGGG